jgi:hypothetical protein
MSQVEMLRSITRPASGDLSAGLMKFTKLDSSGQAAICSVAGELAIGVLQNKPTAAGQAAEVAVAGVVKVIASATITPNQKVSTTNAGLAKVAVSTEHPLGVCVKGGAVNEVIEVLMGCPPILA